MKNKEKILEATQYYLALPEEERSLTSVGKLFNIRRQSISEELKRIGVEVINYQNKSRVNHKIFDSIDTEEKAYWLGFIYADGNISHTGNRFEMRLSMKDENHMKKFSIFIGNENKYRSGICNGNKFVHFSVRNKHLWNTLNSYGCTPRKSLTLEFPDERIFKSKDLIRHFIRGYFDGDGSVSWCKHGLLSNGDIKYVENVSFVGTNVFLEKINKFLGYNFKIRNKSSKNYQNKAFQISATNKKAREILHKLYDNSTIYLDRKKDKFLFICRLREQSLNYYRAKSVKAEMLIPS